MGGIGKIAFSECEVEVFYGHYLRDLRNSGGEWRAACPLHGSDHRLDSLAVEKASGNWFCHSGCGCGGNLIEFEKRISKCDFKEACANISCIIGRDLLLLLTPRNHNARRRLVKKYVYSDATGKPLFHVLRYDPKSFGAEQPDGTPHIKGIARVLYNLPAVIKAPIVFVTEGEKDADAVNALGLVATTCAFGAGKWTKRFSQQLLGKQVVILPDADGNGRMHSDLVARSLLGCSTSIKIVNLPTEKDCKKVKDISDFLDAGGREEDLIKLAEAAQQYAPAPIEDQAAEEAAKAPAVAYLVETYQLADAITRDHHFASDPGGLLYHYVDGVYRRTAEQFVWREVKRLLKVGRASEEWTVKLNNEVVAYIRADCPALWDEPPANIVNLESGLLNLLTREQQPHTPEHLSTVRIPVNYNPGARCPESEKFFGEVFPERSTEIAYEIPAWLLSLDHTIQASILLIGEGANGKSTYLEAVRRFTGRGNTSSVTLQALETNRFAVASLYGKLANICPDLPSAALVGSSIFKAITGGDFLQGEYKFKNSFTFRPFCKLLFSANRPPRSSDDSDAFFRRWTVIPFNRRFSKDSPNTLPQDVLLARLTEPGEMSGLLNRALDAGDRLRAQRHFTETEATREAFTEFRRTTDPFSVWLDENTVLAANGFIPQC